MTKESEYKVIKLEKAIPIDGNWEKREWQKCSALRLKNFMGTKPGFFPKVLAKIMYDEENVYVIFLVEDRFVRCITKDFNGPVWEDSCVEFFFSPDGNSPERYFNLEINCGGTALMHYNVIRANGVKETTVLGISDLEKIEIAHSLPQIIDPEIKSDIAWTIEYKIPLNILRQYSNVDTTEKGVQWKANFYKISENSSNPHYLTWAEVVYYKPNFHLPQFFGTLSFH